MTPASISYKALITVSNNLVIILKQTMHKPIIRLL